MSDSEADEEKISVGILLNNRCRFTRRKTSPPATFGRFQSKRTRSGHQIGLPEQCLYGVLAVVFRYCYFPSYLFVALAKHTLDEVLVTGIVLDQKHANNAG
jgi:hypothetical protein